MDKYEKHQELCNRFNEVYRNKNADYGESFAKVYQKVGILSAYTRIADKFYRFESLIGKTKDEQRVKGESIIDTLLDLANYCIMTAMELEEGEEKFNGV